MTRYFIVPAFVNDTADAGTYRNFTGADEFQQSYWLWPLHWRIMLPAVPPLYLSTTELFTHKSCVGFEGKFAAGWWLSQTRR